MQNTPSSCLRRPGPAALSLAGKAAMAPVDGPAARQGGQRGMSLVELMVGITVGLIVAAGASTVAVNQINEHRRLMLEVQVQQDLRAAADLLQQDLRRAGFRGLPQYTVWQPGSGAGTPNELPARPASASPYASAVQTDTQSHRSLTYSYALAEDNTDDIRRSNENFGIRWDKLAQVLQLKLGSRNGQDNWQPITDPESVRIIDFNAAIEALPAGVGDFCDTECTGAGCPRLEVRRVSFTIRARAHHDASIVRSLSGAERIRADALAGACTP